MRKRDDGFHDIETVFYPVNWKDAIEYLPVEKTSIEILGRALEGNPADNFVLKAYNALVEVKALPPLHFKLLKNIPAGAGLGGGSANAAATLKKLDADFEIGLSDDALAKLALNIGSDCPFFLQDQTCVATGRGEVLKPIEVDLSKHWLMVIFPDVHVNTAWAYKTFAQRNLYSNVQNDFHQGGQVVETLKQPVETWKENLANDFEQIVFEAHPALSEVKKALYKQGAVYASLSGSGSSLFGIFETKPDESELANVLKVKPENIWVEKGRSFSA